MYTTHQTNKRTLDFFYNIGWFKGTDSTFVTIHYLHSAISFCCECVSTYHRMHCRLKQHNFWHGLEALAPSSKLTQKCCLYSHKRPLYVMEWCFLGSTLYQSWTSRNHRGHLHYNSWWMSGATGIPFEYSCPRRLGNEGYPSQNHYLVCLSRQSILKTSPAFFVFHLPNQRLTALF